MLLSWRNQALAEIDIPAQSCGAMPLGEGRKL
jgi:hypothetical protein